MANYKRKKLIGNRLATYPLKKATGEFNDRIFGILLWYDSYLEQQ